MSFIDNNIIPILSGENLNMIVLDYKEEQYKKIISNSKRHRKYYIEKIEEITNEKIINLSVAGTTTLTGATTLNNNLSVSGTTTLTGAATLNNIIIIKNIS